MYNKNGLFLINNAAYAGSGSINYSGTDVITFSNGTKNGSSPVYVYYSGSTGTLANGVNCCARLLMSGFTTGYVSVALPTTNYNSNTYFRLGYRASEFTEETFNYPSQVDDVNYSVAITAGRATITAINNGNSDAVINELVVAISGGTATGTAIAGGIVIAGFHFPDITIAPGESYTFTITHKNG